MLDTCCLVRSGYAKEVDLRWRNVCKVVAVYVQYNKWKMPAKERLKDEQSCAKSDVRFDSVACLKHEAR